MNERVRTALTLDVVKATEATLQALRPKVQTREELEQQLMFHAGITPAQADEVLRVIVGYGLRIVPLHRSPAMREAASRRPWDGDLAWDDQIAKSPFSSNL